MCRIGLIVEYSRMQVPSFSSGCKATWPMTMETPNAICNAAIISCISSRQTHVGSDIQNRLGEHMFRLVGGLEIEQLCSAHG
jgi:hypothetical protein